MFPPLVACRHIYSLNLLTSKQARLCNSQQNDTQKYLLMMLNMTGQVDVAVSL
jgi:hypothetical protein